MAEKISAEYIQKISEAVYRELLSQSAGGPPEFRATEADRMIAKDGDGGAKFSRRAAQYSHVVRATLQAVGRLDA